MVVLAVNGLLRYRQMFHDLSRSEAWMRALLATTVDGVITVGRDGIITEFNASAERIFGWRRDEIVGRSVGLLLTDTAARSQVAAAPRRARQRHQRPGRRLVACARMAAKSRCAARSAMRALAEQDLFVCFVTDISERRAMEQALRDSEQQFRSLIGNIPGISTAACSTAPADAVHQRRRRTRDRLSGGDFLGAPPRRSFGALIHAEDRARVAGSNRAGAARTAGPTWSNTACCMPTAAALALGERHRRARRRRPACSGSTASSSTSASAAQMEEALRRPRRRPSRPPPRAPASSPT